MSISTFLDLRILILAAAALPFPTVLGQTSESAFLRPTEAFVLSCDNAAKPAVRVIDFGPDGVAGYPILRVTATRSAADVRLSYACVPELGRDGDFTQETSARYLGQDVDLPILPANINRFDDFAVTNAGVYVSPLQQGLVRYVRVELATPGGEVSVAEVGFENRGTYSTEPVVGRFACSDQRLTDLWRASVRTCQLAAIPARIRPLHLVTSKTNVVLGTTYAYLSDGAKRDRLVWSGDLWWAQRNMYVAFSNDNPYMPGSLRMLADNQTPTGYVQACPYPESHGPVKVEAYGLFQSDEFSCWFVPVLWTHYLHTGDSELVRELYPNVKLLMEYLAEHTREDGLFEQRPETSKHANDLAFGASSTHHRALMNVLLWLTCRDAARLAWTAGATGDAKCWECRSEKTARAVRERFMLPSGQLCISLEDRRVGGEANALALGAGFFTFDEAKRVLPAQPRLWHGKFQMLTVRGAFAYGAPDEALKRIAEHNWLKVVDPVWVGVHTTSECMNYPTCCDWGDECHPDTAIAGDLTQGILGIVPTAPGYRRFRFVPGAANGIDWAEGEIPTPHGPIIARWQRENGRIVKHVTCPSGLVCEDEPSETAWLSVPEAPVFEGVADEGVRAADGTSWFVTCRTNVDEVVRAKWTVAGLGVFDVYVNGKRVGDDFLKPGFTHNAKTKYSFSYDVTPLLRVRPGEANVFAAEVSAGWWRDKIVTPAGRRGFFGRKSAFRGELEVFYTDGSIARYVTNTNGWRCGVGGPVTHAAIFDGEEYDARIRPPSDGAGLLSVPERNEEFKGEVFPSDGAEVCLRRDLAIHRGPIRVSRGTPVVVDFGQNCAAVPEFRFRARRGTVLTVLPGEMLNDVDRGSRGSDGPKGSVYRENLRCPGTGMRIIYTFSGEGDETYLPRFSYFGYRYLSLLATDDIEIESVVSIPVSSVTKAMETGRIEVGDPSLDRFIRNVYWGQLSNYLSIPTDCPQRNERLGWTADTQIFCEAGSFNADTRSFFMKYMRDMRDSRCADGGFPSVAPFAQYGNDTFTFGWADAGVIVPYTVWRQFGDLRIVEDNFDAMARFVRKIDEKKYDFEDKLRMIYADWLSYERYETFALTYGGPDSQKGDPLDAKTYRRYLAACYWLMDARMVAAMAEALERPEEAKWFRESADRALAYIRSRFLESDGLVLNTFRDMQTACVFALRFGIVDGVAKVRTLEILKRSIAEHSGCLQTGFLGTSFLMDVLTDNGASDVAYNLLFQHKCPSWLYSVDQGATTVWERWNSYTVEDGFGPVAMNSFNHYAYGAVLAWIYRTVAGIAPDPKIPGYKRFVLAPIPDRRVGCVRAEYRSAAGLIRSVWRYEGEKWIWEFTVPEGAAAMVRVPGEETTTEYASGTYTLERVLR